MKRISLSIRILAMLAGLTLAGSQGKSQGQMGISVRNGQLQSFYFALGDYYRVPEREVWVIHDEGIREDEVPVVLFIARHSRYQPEEIIRLRHDGYSWTDISARCGVQPEQYLVVDRPAGPPYGNAWGYYKHGPGSRGRERFSDEQFVNAVNVRFLTDRYGCSQDDVYRLHSRGESYANIHEEFRSHGRGHGGNNDDQGEGRGRGHGKGHGNGKHKGWKGDD